MWICPFTKKKFSSEATYANWARTKKFRELAKKGGFARVEDVAPVVKDIHYHTHEKQKEKEKEEDRRAHV